VARNTRETVVVVLSAILLLALGVVLPVTIKFSPEVLTVFWTVIILILFLLAVLATPLRRIVAQFLMRTEPTKVNEEDKNQQDGPPAPPASLEARYEQREPYLHQTCQAWIFEHRIGIHNPCGNEVAAHVRLELLDVLPRPRDLPPETPMAMSMLSGGDERIGISLLPGEQEYWVIGSTATGSDGTISAGPWAYRDPRWGGTPWKYDPAYPWRFTYQIVADGLAAARYSVVMLAVNCRIQCKLEED
jgi:uncharacterized membrane protein